MLAILQNTIKMVNGRRNGNAKLAEKWIKEATRDTFMDDPCIRSYYTSCEAL